jgi:hypothetical protein
MIKKVFTINILLLLALVLTTAVYAQENEPCVGSDPHPVLQSISDTYEVEYSVVMDWFCSGYGVGEIMLAFQTADVTGGDPGEILASKTELGGWGKVWQSLGLIGRPEDAGPPEGKGKPDHAGPPEGKGKPDHAGPPDDKGKPDHTGPPEGKGKPDHAGPPDGKGKPDHAGPKPKKK